MPDAIVVVPYNTTWPQQFLDLANPMREEMGDIALRIDHIGSTAIPNLAAKPIIDIQISVAMFDPFEPILKPLKALGYRWRDDNSDLTKRYFREPEGQPRTHIHVRKSGSWPEQFNLLFRDYLRVHPEAAAKYEAVKYQLAEQYRDERSQYVDGKAPIIWEIMQKANVWSQLSGWASAASDV